MGEEGDSGERDRRGFLGKRRKEKRLLILPMGRTRGDTLKKHQLGIRGEEGPSERKTVRQRKHRKGKTRFLAEKERYMSIQHKEEGWGRQKRGNLSGKKKISLF